MGVGLLHCLPVLDVFMLDKDRVHPGLTETGHPALPSLGPASPDLLLGTRGQHTCSGIVPGGHVWRLLSYYDAVKHDLL